MTVHASRLSIAAVAMVIGASSPANAGLVYDNGPLGPTTLGISINKGFSISDSFTLSGATTLQQATAAFWTIQTDNSQPIGVGWSIGSTPFGHDLGMGFSTTSNVFVGLSDFVYSDGTRFDVYESTFSINAALGAGTYYLTLANATAVNDATVEWDANGGPSTGYFSYAGGASGVSESFQLYGSAAVTVPEPSSIALVGVGGVTLVVGAIGRRRRVAR